MNPCPICDGNFSTEFVHRSCVPLLQNRVWADVKSAREAPRGGLAMRACHTCGFVWNDSFDSSINIYDSAYDNSQMQSPHFREHADAMAQTIIRRLSSRRLNLVEVGCGQGLFISRLVHEGEKHFASLSGFDPAWRGHPVPGVRMHACYFGPRVLPLLEGAADIVVSRHTIEHVPDPLTFLRTIRDSMSKDREARLFLETPDLDWILSNFQFHDFFYEHCSLFTKHSIKFALEAAGFEVVETSKVFGGQYLWTEAKPSTVQASMEGLGREPFSPMAGVLSYQHREAEIVNYWRKFIEQRSPDRNIWIWGASSKGVTFALLVDPDGQRLKGAIDINQNKTDRFMPITGLPVAAPEVLRGGEIIIIMNPNYKAEIIRDIECMGICVDVIVLGEA